MISFTPPAQPVLLHATPAKDHTAPHGWQTHVVRPGDTLFDLALRYRTTVPKLVERNHLRGAGHLIMTGTTLAVPRTSAAPRPSATRHRAAAQPRAHTASRANAKRPARATTTVRVRSGDTISALALAHRASPAAIIKANRITDPRALQPGQSLRIPGSATAAPAKRRAAARRSVTVTVRPGDTVSGLALAHRVSQAAIMRAAGISSPLRLWTGQRLQLTTTAAAKAAPRRKPAATSPAFSSTTFAGRRYTATVIRAATANRRHLAGRSVPSRLATRDLIRRTAIRHGLDPRLALAIAWQESGWNQRQVSIANAIGTMQVIPGSGQWASELVGRKLNLLDAQDNVTAGVVILRALTRSAANETEAIAGYYQGLEGVRRNGMYADTRQYVATIRLLKSRM